MASTSRNVNKKGNSPSDEEQKLSTDHNTNKQNKKKVTRCFFPSVDNLTMDVKTSKCARAEKVPTPQKASRCKSPQVEKLDAEPKSRCGRESAKASKIADHDMEAKSKSSKKVVSKLSYVDESIHDYSLEDVDEVAVRDSRELLNYAQNRKESRRYSMSVRKYSYEGTYGHYSTRRIHLLNRLYNLGEKGSGIRIFKEAQDFTEIHKSLLSSKKLFEDPQFPAVASSLFVHDTPPVPITWKRPFEICKNPQLFVEGATRFDINQGELGDCWLLASVASLTLNVGLLAQTIPADQDFSSRYAGIFHFRFWQYGRWIDVVVDDRLPTNAGQLVFLHSKTPNEFWSALFEKAYAKLHGSYEALKGGGMSEAMEDFTGGVAELLEINQAPQDIYKIMYKATERSSLIGCSIDPNPEVEEEITNDGLVKGHGYSLTGLKTIVYKNETVPLVRLRNPWGNETEWNGPWCDTSPEWNSIPDDVKKNIGLTFSHDGEFWMSYDDFIANFTLIEVCNLSPDSVSDLKGKTKRWEMSVFEGEWVKGVTAGGCRNFLDTFCHNPQYSIRLDEPDADSGDANCSVIIAVMQKNRRFQRRWGEDLLNIGFTVYNLQDQNSLPKPLDVNFFKRATSAGRSPYVMSREVSCRFKLPPGTYCIVPTTYEPMVEGEFIIRVFSESSNYMEEYDERIGIGDLDERLAEIPLPDQEQQMKAYFNEIAGDDMEVDWMELRSVLNKTVQGDPDSEGFSKEVCKSLVAMMDTDKSGQLGYEETKALFETLRMWRSVFKLHDEDNSKTLSSFELRSALNSAGYKVNNHILQVLTHRYGSVNGEMAFDDFIMCAIRLKTMIDIYEHLDPKKTNYTKFSIEEWVGNSVYS